MIYVRSDFLNLQAKIAIVAQAILMTTWFNLPGLTQNPSEFDPQNQIQTIFTPYDDGLAAYKSFLDRSRKSVFMAGFALGDKEIVDKLIELRKNKGIEVHILLDFSQTRGRSANTETALIKSLQNAGIEVLIGSSDKSHQLMHDKYTIIDNEWVESGSWNYTSSANKQDNVLDFVKSPKRAKLFQENWDRMHASIKSQEDQRAQSSFIATTLKWMSIALMLLATLAGTVFWWKKSRSATNS